MSGLPFILRAVFDNYNVDVAKMKFKVFIILLFSCSNLVGSMPYYEIQPTSHLGDYPVPSVSQEGITSEKWPSNLARSQNTNLRSGPAFGELPSNNFQSPLGSNRPVEVSHPNYNYHQQKSVSQGPVPGKSYTNPISESYLPVQQEPYENIHTIHAGRTGYNEPLQTIPQSFVPPHPQNYENLQNVHESYENPVRIENFNNIGNKHTFQKSIQNERAQSTELYRDIKAMPHSYYNENLHSIRAVPKESYKIESLEPTSPITYESIGNEENLNPIQKVYLRHNEPHQRVPAPQETYTVPLQHTYKNIPEVGKVNIAEELLTYNLFNYGEHPLKQLISNPKIKEIIQSTKNKKRFMVIHNDGTVEHTDILSPAVTTNPNYVMLSGGKVVPKEILPAIIGPSYIPPSGSKTIIAPKLPGSTEPFLHAEDVVAKSPHSGAITSPTNAIASDFKSPTTDEPHTEKGAPSIIENLFKLEDGGSNPSKPNPTPIETNKELSNQLNHKTPNNKNTENKPSKQTLTANPSKILLNETATIKPVHKNSVYKTNDNPENCDSSQLIAPEHPTAINPVDTVLNETKKTNNTTLTTINNQKNLSSDPLEVSPSTPVHDDEKNEENSPWTDATESTTPCPVISNKKYSSTKPKIPSKQQPSDNKTTQKEPLLSQPGNITTKNSNGAKKSTEPAVEEDEDNDKDDEKDEKDERDEKEEKNEKDEKDEKYEKDEKDEKYEKDEKDEDENPEEKKLKPTATVKPDKNGDNGEIVTKDFIRKLIYANNNPEALFVFYVQDQPLLEREVTRTIYPNGTIIEEITEVINEQTDENCDEEDDTYKPKKTQKTVKIITP